MILDENNNVTYTEQVPEITQEPNYEAALASLDAWDCWDGRGQLNQITSPTLILWSNKDQSYDWNQQEVLNKGISNSKVEVVDGCAHNSHMEKPDLINSIIKHFLI